jgi:ParB family chromosome partitioning protein
MQPASLAHSSTKSSLARKGSRDAAGKSADDAFTTQSALSLSDVPAAVPPDQVGRRRLNDTYSIRIESIVPDPNQPRRAFDAQAMNELVDSIRARGVKQPLSVRWDAGAERYRIIDGGRRYEAAKQIGLAELPCWVQRADGRDVLIDQVVHNWIRADLEPLETAGALARLRDEFDMSQQDIAATTGKPKGEISKFLAIHDNVTPEVKQLADDSTAEETPLTKRHLYNLAQLPPKEQAPFAKRVRSEKLTAMATEKLIREKKSAGSAQVRERGISARQRKFHTSRADVLMTFRKKGFTDDDVRQVVTEIADQLARSVES